MVRGRVCDKHGVSEKLFPIHISPIKRYPIFMCYLGSMLIRSIMILWLPCAEPSVWTSRGLRVLCLFSHTVLRALGGGKVPGLQGPTSESLLCGGDVASDRIG